MEVVQTLSRHNCEWSLSSWQSVRVGKIYEAIHVGRENFWILCQAW
jgi:hypothetical protein